MMKIYILALVLAIAKADKFSVKDGKNQTCLLLNVDGMIDLTLHEGSKSTVATVTFEGAGVIEGSNCTLIKLNLTKSVELWFQFQDMNELWSVKSTAQFNPQDVFPGKFNKSGEAYYSIEKQLNFQKNESYTCNSKFEHPFKEEKSKIGQNISVTVTTKNFKIQAVKDEAFVPGESCDEDPTTTASPTTTVTPTTTATPTTTVTPPVTTLKPNFTQDFLCNESHVTSFRLTGSYSMDVAYNTTDGKQRKAYIVVPKTTTYSANCSSNTSQSLTFEFFKGWAISYVFESEKPNMYHISNITVKYVHDGNFPNSTDKDKTFYANFASKDYLETSSGKYYYCRSKSHLSFEEVTLYTSEFKYEAFNENKDIDFTGSVSECPADEDTSSVVPIAVGAALAGLVVIVLVAYLIGRRRSRKAGYESV